jgi:hypothetical protein
MLLSSAFLQPFVDALRPGFLSRVRSSGCGVDELREAYLCFIAVKAAVSFGCSKSLDHRPCCKRQV